MRLKELLTMTACAMAMTTLAQTAFAAPPNCELDPTHKKCGGGDGGGDPGNGGGTGDPTFGWMHPDVGLAFGDGVNGAGSHIVILDNFSGAALRGKLTGGKPERRYHGGWVSYTSRLVAPGASVMDVQNSTGEELINGGGTNTFYTDITQTYGANGGINVVNMSFGLFDPVDVVTDGSGNLRADYTLEGTEGLPLWDTLVTAAHDPSGTAVFVKAAGNLNGAWVDTGTLNLGFPSEPNLDALNLMLIGAQNALFVGALSTNGSVEAPATIAGYSTIAGGNTAVQDMFLVAGVDASQNGGLEGTSFAAPIVSGYAAIIGDKFNADSAATIVDRLLVTARTDTIADFSDSCTLSDATGCIRSSVYGMGEASLWNALAPDALN